VQVGQQVGAGLGGRKHTTAFGVHEAAAVQQLPDRGAELVARGPWLDQLQRGLGQQVAIQAGMTPPMAPAGD
jgi:hypothetical protein